MCVSRGDARQKRKRMRRKAYGVFPVGFEPEKKPPPPPPHWYPKEAALFRILGILRLSHHPLLYPGPRRSNKFPTNIRQASSPALIATVGAHNRGFPPSDTACRIFRCGQSRRRRRVAGYHQKIPSLSILASGTRGCIFWCPNGPSKRSAINGVPRFDDPPPCSS